jgi:hypothetical protein
MSSAINILLVDDSPIVKEEISKNLEIIGVKNKIDYFCPQIDTPITDLLPSGSALNKYGLALVDLELYPLKENATYSPDDLAGGTQVLPYLRKEAPWLPVIAESRLFGEEAEYFVAIAGSYGFDGHMPRHVFRSSVFNRALWDVLFSSAILSRKRSILGSDYTSSNERLKIITDKAIESFLDQHLSSWQQLIRDIFYYSDKVTINPIGEGFSGAITLHTQVIQRSVDESTSAEWLLKLSNNPWKLNKEVEAHLAFMRSGAEYARTVPLLWRGIVSEMGIGGIAYQFAAGTKVALSICNDINSSIELSKRILPLFQKIYKNEKIVEHTDNISNLLKVWFSNNRLEQAIKNTSNEKFRKDLTGVLDNGECGDLGKIVHYKRCWIHGDLHLRNILIGERDVLIDFARSKPGPLVLDIAKLTSDLLLNVTELRGDRFPSLSGTDHPINRVIEPFNNLFKFIKDEINLYNIFLKMFLLISLNYPDIKEEAKSWINKIGI